MRSLIILVGAIVVAAVIGLGTQQLIELFWKRKEEEDHES